MGKYGKYEKKYNRSWESEENFKGWLTRNETNDGGEAYCKVCRKALRAQKNDLLKHKISKLHRNNFTKVQPPKNQQKVTEIVEIKDNFKEEEVIVSAFIAIHSSIRSVDHLTNIINDVFLQRSSNSTCSVKKIKLHRTKCTMLIKNVMGEAFKEELIEDVGQSAFSLIVDESTDVSIFKYLALCIRYYSKKSQSITTTFLGLIKIGSASAEALADVTVKFLESISLDINNMVGIGTDGASNLCGKNNSLYSILKRRNPKIQLVKCVAHSLHLCCKAAAQSLPASMDFLCQEVYNWFSKSSLRREKYKNLFDLINIGENRAQHQFLQHSDTRWLARANIMKVMLEQWLELTSYFEIECTEGNDKSYMARTLLQMLKDNNNNIILTIATDVFLKVNKVNALFQMDNADMCKIYNDLFKLLLSLLTMIVKPIFLADINEFNEKNLDKIHKILNNDLAFINADLVDFGYNYRKAVKDYNVTIPELLDIKMRSVSFIKILCLQICQRIPENLHVFKGIEQFSFEYALNSVSRPKFDELPLEILHENVDLAELESQWRDLTTVNWDRNCSVQEFWAHQVRNYMNAGGQKIFFELSEFALTIFCLPLSNAIVERVFSWMNLTKTRIRNKISFSLLDSLIRVKSCFVLKKTCCFNFKPSKNLMVKFKTSMYDHKRSSQKEHEESEAEAEQRDNNTIELFAMLN